MTSRKEKKGEWARGKDYSQEKKTSIGKCRQGGGKYLVHRTDLCIQKVTQNESKNFAPHDFNQKERNEDRVCSTKE